MASENDQLLTREDRVKYIREKIKDIRVAMLTTVAASGTLHSRPMHTTEVDLNADVWFFTSESSEKMQAIFHDGRVLLSYANPSANTYVNLRGKAQQVDDPAMKERLFNPAVKAWFPKGLDDPDLTLLKVAIDEAEYWDSSSSSLVVGMNMLKAIVTGKEYDEGTHNKILL